MKPSGLPLHKKKKSRKEKNNAFAAVGLAMLLLASIAMAAGCGDSASKTTSSTAVVSDGTTRPAPGTVEILDARNDIQGGQNVTQAPTWLDINWASIAKDTDNLKFSLDVAGKLPETMQPGLLAAEMGFLLDVDKDGVPDWGIYGAFTQTGWSPGLYNIKTKDRLADAQFPGTFSHEGTTLVFTINPAKIGSTVNFRWFAYTDAGLITGTDGTVSNAGDRIGDQFQPGDSNNWPEYP